MQQNTSECCVQLISIHGAKYPNEQIIGNLQRAISRYQVKHTVLNDTNKALYTAYNITSWPTFLVFDPIHMKPKPYLYGFWR